MAALTWLTANAPSGVGRSNVAYIRNNIFVAFSSNSIMRSTDGGANWSTITAPFSNMESIATNGSGRVIIVGYSQIAISNDDGATWTTHTHGLGVNLFHIVYDAVNAKWVAFPLTGTKAFYSADGSTWTATTLPGSKSYYVLGAGNGTIVAPWDDTTSAYISRDGGVTWTSIVVGSGKMWKDIAYGNDKFMISIGDSEGTTKIGIVAGDGSSGSVGGLGVNGYWGGIAYGMGKWIVVDQTGSKYAMSEDDGATWTSYSLPSESYYNDAAFGGSNFVITANGNVYYAVLNTAPTTPSSISIPSTIRGGQDTTISWGASTDVDNNLSGYILERRVGDGAWTQVYRGANRSYTDTVPFGSANVNYRVAAYDVKGAVSGYRTGTAVTVINNTAPTISGADGNLGTIGTSFPAQAYTVSDAQGGTVTVVERFDGNVKRSYTATLGASNSFSFTAAEWLKVLNGNHTITITATDQYGESATRTWTLTKAVNTFTFTIDPLPADAMPTKCIVGAYGSFPASSTLKVEVCNNANDASPTWEDVSAKLNEKHFFNNAAKTAGAWAFGLRVTLTRGNAVGDCYLDYININFA